jgi:ribosomal protein S18 acetylase RimI-like enzyme
MIQLITVSNSIELNDDIEQIYLNSFPSDERKEWQELKDLLNHPNFSLNKIVQGGKSIGLITFWDLPDFVFIEHFAIHESHRGKGTGVSVIKIITEEKPIKIVVEVEEPTTVSNRRRIAFYERLGFTLNEDVYYQPPYSTDKNEVKMLLMSYPEKIKTNNFEEIKTQIHQLVYHQQ